MKLRFPSTRYRVVRDRWLGYQAQFRPWWLLFWMPCERGGGGVEFNSNDTLERARQLCANHARYRRSPAGQVVARFSARELEAQQ